MHSKMSIKCVYTFFSFSPWRVRAERNSQNLEALQQHIDDMQARCEEAQSRLQQTNASCQSLLERASGLRAMRYVI